MNIFTKRPNSAVYVKSKYSYVIASVTKNNGSEKITAHFDNAFLQSNTLKNLF